MHLDVACDLFEGQVVVIDPEGVFDFFRDHFNAGEYVKDENDDRDDIVTHGKNETHRQCHHIKENEFFDEDRIGVRDRGVLDALTGTADIRECCYFSAE